MNVTLCLTHDCNLRCAYCYAGLKQERRMTWETAKRAIDFAFEHAVSRARLMGKAPEAQLGYFGGEPLLEWDLLTRSSAYADEEAARLGLGLKKTVTTNMTLLDVAKIDWLRENAFKEGYAACDKCGFGLDEVAVAASGNLYPCERIVGDDTNTELCLGTVFDGFDGAQRRLFFMRNAIRPSSQSFMTP